MVGNFATAFEMGIRLSALVLVAAIIGAAVIGRIIEGEITGSHAAIGLLFVAGLLLGVVFFWNSPLVFVVFLLAAGLATLWVLGQAASERHLTTQMHSEEEARYKAAIERDPKNAAAWSSLGDLYLETHRYDEAITCYERAVQLMPTDAGERRKLHRARQIKAETEARMKSCPQCKALLSRFSVTCPECGFELSAPVWVYLLAAVKDKAAMRKVLIVFVIAFPLAAFWFSLLSALNPLWRAILILATLSAIGIVLLIELRG